SRNDAATLPRRHFRAVRQSRPANRMNRSILRLLYVHELRMLLRARRTVIMAVVLPAVIMPLMIYAQKYSYERRQRTLTGATYRYAVTGPLAERMRVLIRQTYESLPHGGDPNLEELRQYKFVETDVPDPSAR